MSKFPEKLWTLCHDIEEKSILTYLYFSETENYAIYLSLKDIDDMAYVGESIIISKDSEPNEFMDEAYWEDYPTLLKFRNKLIDESIEHHKERIKKLESSKIYE